MVLRVDWGRWAVAEETGMGLGMGPRASPVLLGCGSLGTQPAAWHVVRYLTRRAVGRASGAHQSGVRLGSVS